MQVRMTSDGRMEVSGYVNAVERESRPLHDKDGYFTETISQGAFARALQRGGRRQMLLNHDNARVLAEEGDNLTLKEDAVGLFARATIDDAAVIEKALANQLRGWSFGFLPIRQREEERSGMKHRIVEDMQLFEVSLIDSERVPAYEATSVFTRDDSEPIEVRMMPCEAEVLGRAPEEPDTQGEPPDLSGYSARIEALRSIEP